MARFSDGGAELLCSFCGKSQHEVQKLIAGPGVYICDECVDLCAEIIQEELHEGDDRRLPPVRLPTDRTGTGPAGSEATHPPRIEPFGGARSASVEGIIEASRQLGEGQPLNIFTTMAHHPRALKHVFALGGAFLMAGNLDGRLREIVILRVARNTRCEYEYAQHRVIGQQAGLSPEDIDQLMAPGLAGDWTEVEQVVVAATDQLCASDHVNDATWALLADAFDDRELVELVLLVGYYGMIAGFLNSAGVPLEAGLAGWGAPRPRPPPPEL